MHFVQPRHEEMAAFMACAHAKFTGEVGVCAATSGPGAIHLLNGLYDAKMDHQPVVAIVGQSARPVLGGDYQQEVDPSPRVGIQPHGVAAGKRIQRRARPRR
jgi:pyruvate dehydrogenase (quinone)